MVRSIDSLHGPKDLDDGSAEASRKSSVVTTVPADDESQAEHHHHRHSHAHRHESSHGSHHSHEGHGHHGKNHGKKKAPKPPATPLTKTPCFHHFKGTLWLILLLAFHFVCFMATVSMGLGVGILAAEFHRICWGTSMDPFWSSYIMLIFVYIAVVLYFQLAVGTKFSNWMTRKICHYRIELYFIPRGLYLGLYIFAIVNLYLQYEAVHQLHPHSDSNSSSVNSTNITSTNKDVTAAAPDNSEPLIIKSSQTGPDSANSPLARVDGGNEHQTLFILSLGYMMYVITKENDWTTHRLMTLAKGEPDPMEYGSLSNLFILFGVHFIMTILYSLPLVGYSFMLLKFGAAGDVLYFTICPIAASVGVFGSFIERRSPFPLIPMEGPIYAYENHLRIRVSLIHYWLIPLAAGRFFNSNNSIELNASNYDFIVFCIEISIGIVSVVQVIGNDIYLLYFHWDYDNVDAPRLPSIDVPPLVGPDNVEGDTDSFTAALADGSEAQHDPHHQIQEVEPHEVKDIHFEHIDNNMSDTEWSSQVSPAGKNNEPVNSLVRKLV